MQSMLLGVYRAVNASGVLSTRPGRSLFEWGYHGYKRLLEAGDIRALAALIKPGTEQFGYGLHRIISGKVSPPMMRQEAVALCQGGNYADFLCIHDQKASGERSSGT